MNDIVEGPPGFPPLFSELHPQERKAALLYISHSDKTERQARIMRVRQAIEDQSQSHMAILTRFTSDLDKGKGHVFSYPDPDHLPRVHLKPRATASLTLSKEIDVQEGYSESECSGAAVTLTPSISTGFQIGLSSKTPSAGDSNGVKGARRRPPSWKRKAQAGKSSAKAFPSSEITMPPLESGGKRKPETVSMSPSKKSSTPTSISEKYLEMEEVLGPQLSFLSLLALTLPLAIASDPSPLQDFCVGVNTPASGVFVNGKFCKDPRIVNADDFFSSVLNRPGNLNNAVGSNVTTVNVDNLGGLNTLGISLVRIDYAPNGQNPPHTHPRATEILVVQQGTLLVGFVSSNQDRNRLFAKTLNVGDVFVFPEGLIHFQFNLGRTPAVAIAALSSQNAGVITIANTVFGSNPAIDPNVLARAFQMDANVVRDLQNRTPGEIGSLETSTVNVTLSSSTIQSSRELVVADWVLRANGCHPHLIAPKEGYHRLIESSIVFMGGPSESHAILLKDMDKSVIDMSYVLPFFLSLLALTLPLAIASDPSPLQDFCVGVNTPASGVFVNGKFCKDPRIVNADDFFSSVLNRPGNVNNAVGSNVTTVNVNNLGGLNTLGISLVRIDYAPNGQNPPHTHPRATEILVVQQGTLLVGFVSSNQDGNRLFAKTLNVGDVFVFPEGLIHFQFNLGRTPAVAIAALSSQNAGVITIANTVFGSNPAIDPNVLARAFQMDANVIRDLQNRF
ncbi:hypothetical protein HID58_080241 [Brassica napus]|uniref:Cupin type-1 domain-containing protein n=1 Tax=Brassica napus TaxID=3708 RepID=A0ABQ7Y4B4_BRANA|nr:hypothetical protein HID58_080241 [Brassica napus]